MLEAIIAIVYDGKLKLLDAQSNNTKSFSTAPKSFTKEKKPALMYSSKKKKKWQPKYFMPLK